MKWWRRWTRERAHAPTHAFTGPLDKVLDCLEACISDPKRAAPVLEAAARFRSSAGPAREERFVPVYVQFRHYLSRIERNPVDAREVCAGILNNYPELLAHPAIAVIFADHDEQEVLLQCRFLEAVLAASVEMVGAAGSDFLNVSARHVSMLGRWSVVGPHDTHPTSERFVELDRASRSIYEFLTVNVGEGTATKVYEHAYEKTLQLYRSLERFPAVLRLLPERLLDEERLALLSRGQVETALLVSARNLRGHNEELESRVRQRTDEVARAESRLRAITESVPDGIVAVDKHGRIMDWNAGAERMFGYSESQLEGHLLEDLMPPRYRERHLAGMRRVAQGAASKLAGHTVALHGLHRDGHEFPLDLAIGIWTLDGETYFSGVMRDTTERATADKMQKELQDQLRQAQKMEALGRMAGGVAHDFNNLLTVIRGYADILIDDAEKTGMDSAALKEIGVATDRATGLTAQLLAISRTQPRNPVVLDLNAQVRELVPMLRRVITAQIELHIDMADDACPVTMDSTQAMQVILNLSLNAKDAMPNGGSLTIGTDMVLLTAQEVARYPGRQPGRYVRLKVADTGGGIAADMMSHIFEPFFTTKAVGEGTGLGLSVVYGIAEQAGGFIDVGSTAGVGTLFTVFLPCSAASAVASLAEAEAAATPGGGGECILLIEDQTSLRALARRILLKAAYEVIDAADGAEAQRLMDARGAAPDLVVTDVVMPNAGGPEIVRDLVERWGGLKVVFISGYSRDLLEGEFMSNVHFLAKPFSVEALVAKVREALNASLEVRRSDFPD